MDSATADVNAYWADTAGDTTRPGLSYFQLGEKGKVVRRTDFWPDPYELPAQRVHLTERY